MRVSLAALGQAPAIAATMPTLSYTSCGSAAPWSACAGGSVTGPNGQAGVCGPCGGPIGPIGVSSSPSVPGVVTNATTAMYFEWAAAAAVLMLAPGYWKIAAAIPLLIAVGGAWSL